MNTGGLFARVAITRFPGYNHLRPGFHALLTIRRFLVRGLVTGGGVCIHDALGYLEIRAMDHRSGWRKTAGGVAGSGG